MRKSLWLKRRSSLPDFQAHKQYAENRRSDDTQYTYGASAVGGIEGWLMVTEIVSKDPNVHPSLSRIAFFAGATLVSQFFYFRSLAAEDRAAESLEAFAAARQKELDALSSPADASSGVASAEPVESQEALPPSNLDHDQQRPPQPENQDSQPGE